MYLGDQIYQYGVWTESIIALVSLSIALIALRGYVIFRNRKFLLLSLSFFFLVVPVFLNSLLQYEIWIPTGQNPWLEARLFITFFYTVGFTILAMIYAEERSIESINLSKIQWVTIGAAVLITLFILFGGIDWVNNSPKQNISFDIFLIDIQYTIILALLLFVVFSLFSYYKVKKTSQTRFTLAGFICILFGLPGSILGWVLLIPAIIFSYSFDVAGISVFILMQNVITVMGYLLILLGMVRVRFPHGG